MMAEVIVRSLSELRDWLRANHNTSGSVWLLRHRKGTGPTVSTSDVVDELLCWGWIDGLPQARADGYSALRISPRDPKSNWSKVNKDKVARLDRAGRMQAAGRCCVDRAKANGAWTFLDDVDALVETPDLSAALDEKPEARRFWNRFPPSSRRGILEWIKTARRPETRDKRVADTVAKAMTNRKANFPAGRDAGPKGD